MLDRLLYTSLKFVKGNGGAVGLAGKEGGDAATGGFLKKTVFRNFAKFKGKSLCHSVFLNKVASVQLYLKRDSGTGVFL